MIKALDINKRTLEDLCQKTTSKITKIFITFIVINKFINKNDDLGAYKKIKYDTMIIHYKKIIQI